VQAKAGDVDQAAATAGRALDVAVRVKSRAKVHRVVQAAEGMPDASAVRDLKERIGTVRASL
jgi:hypothetical protein